MVCSILVTLVSNDLNSLGVQIKNNAQNFLRKQELFLNNLYRIADNFYIRGLMDPQIKSVIHLNEIYQMIPQEDNRPEEEKHKELLDLKQDIMLFFEKLIWSLFLPLEQFGEGLYDDKVLDRFAIYYIKRFGLDDTIYAKTHGENLNFVDVNDVIRDLKSVRSDFEKLLRENKEPTPLQMVGEKLKFKR